MNCLKNYISLFFAIVGFLIIYGTAGASDCGQISMTRIVIYAFIGGICCLPLLIRMVKEG